MRGPSSPLLTRSSAAPDTTSAPAVATHPGAPARRRGEPGGGGAGERDAGGGGGGAHPPPSATAWWRAERLLPHGLRAVTLVPLVALVLILGVLVWKACARHPLQRARVLHPHPVEPGESLRPHRHDQRGTPSPRGDLRRAAVHRGDARVLGHRARPGRARRHRHRADRGGEAPAPSVERRGILPGSAGRHPERRLRAVGHSSPWARSWPTTWLPLWADHMPDVPVLRFFRSPTGDGEGLFTVGVVLAIMILPIIAATTRDLLRQVPRATVEGARGARHDRCRGTRGRHRPLGPLRGDRRQRARSGPRPGGDHRGAHGVRFAHRRRGPLVLRLLQHHRRGHREPARRRPDRRQRSGRSATLAELGLVLLVITLLANVGARLLVRRVATTALPVGRGI